MAHIKDDTDNSVANNSVFDWGFQSKDSGSKDASVRSGTSGEGKDAPSSRYDPKAMSRIVDINDLVDESDDGDSDDDAIVGHTSGEGSVMSSTKGGVKNKKGKNKKRRATLPPYGPGGVGSVLMCRQVLILVALVAIIAAASVAIGYAVMNGPSEAGSSNREERKQQQLLETAERVIVACAESRLDEDMGECQKLCRKSMCCFESGKYGCEDDEKKNCAVYAGCANLMEGIPTGGAEEDEE